MYDSTRSSSQYRVLFFGSRTWSDPGRIYDDMAHLQDTHNNLVIVNGMAREGADHMARDAATNLGLLTLVFPADWNKHDREGRTPVPCRCAFWRDSCRAAGVRRNQRMIDEGRLDEAFGYRMPGKSTGTDDMVKRLQQAQIPHSLTMFRPVVSLFDD